jgi:hypothetical protein
MRAIGRAIGRAPPSKRYRESRATPAAEPQEYALIATRESIVDVDE